MNPLLLMKLYIWKDLTEYKNIMPKELIKHYRGNLNLGKICNSKSASVLKSHLKIKILHLVN